MISYYWSIRIGVFLLWLGAMILFFGFMMVLSVSADTPTPVPTSTPFRVTPTVCVAPSPVGGTATPVPFMRPAPCDHVVTVPMRYDSYFWVIITFLGVFIVFGLYRLILALLPSS